MDPGVLEDPRCTAPKLPLLDAVFPVVRQICPDQLIGRWSRVFGNQRQWIHRGIECRLTGAGHVRQQMKCRGAGERMTGACAIAGSSELGWYQHGDHAMGPSQLEGPLEEGNGQIGRVAVATAAASPPAITGSDLPPSVGWDCL